MLSRNGTDGQAIGRHLALRIAGSLKHSTGQGDAMLVDFLCWVGSLIPRSFFHGIVVGFERLVVGP
jgi:hypothetical protein